MLSSSCRRTRGRRLCCIASWTLVTCLICGCGTVQEHRIRRHTEAFEALPAETQEQIREGVVEAGYTEEMVYMALGEPSEVLPADEGEVWVYRGQLMPPDFSEEAERGLFRSRSELMFQALGEFAEMRVVFFEGKVVAITSSRAP